MSGIIETSTATIEFGSDGIIRSVQKPDSEDSIESARESVAAAQKLAGGRDHPLMIDIRKQKSVSKEARKHYTSEEAAKMIKAVAIVVDSPVSRVIGNFFIGFAKHRKPTKLFDSEEEAVGWLKGFIGNE